jgi:hypothetical protein
MRVLVSIGNETVIIEAIDVTIEENELSIYTNENSSDVKVYLNSEKGTMKEISVSDYDKKTIANNLLTRGYADLARYYATYMN